MKSYLITDPKYYSNNPIVLKTKLIKNITSKKPDFVCFRDKISLNFRQLATAFLQMAKELKQENIFLNSDILLAKILGFDGVHLTSTQFNQIPLAKKQNLKVIISTHNEGEILKAIDFQADFITYSPIFYTPNKNQPKGIDNLKDIVCKYPQIKIFALGGIVSDNEIKQLQNIPNLFGFASIRYWC